MANKKSQERELAAQLYINTNLSQKEIAQRVGVTEKTMSAWAEEGKWEDLKSAKHSTNAEIIMGLKELLKSLTAEANRKRKSNEFTKNDADAIVEVAKSIEMLESKDQIPLRTYVAVMEEFMDSVPHEDRIRVQLADYQMRFLLNKAKPN